MSLMEFKPAPPTTFEAFVQKIAEVPKEAADEVEARRGKRARPRRIRVKAKK